MGINTFFKKPNEFEDIEYTLYQSLGLIIDKIAANQYISNNYLNELNRYVKTKPLNLIVMSNTIYNITQLESFIKYNFITDILSRIKTYRKEYEQQQNFSEREVLKQFKAFTNTIKNCLEHPNKTNSYIKYYLGPETSGRRFYPIGEEIITPKTIKRNVSIAIGVISLALGISAFFFCLPLAATAILFSILVAAPMAFIYGSPKEPDTTTIKSEEEQILNEVSDSCKYEQNTAVDYNEVRDQPNLISLSP